MCRRWLAAWCFAGTYNTYICTKCCLTVTSRGTSLGHSVNGLPGTVRAYYVIVSALTDHTYQFISASCHVPRFVSITKHTYGGDETAFCLPDSRHMHTRNLWGILNYLYVVGWAFFITSCVSCQGSSIKIRLIIILATRQQCVYTKM